MRVNRWKKGSSFGIKARKLAWHKRLARPLEEGIGPQRYRERAVLIEAMRGSFKQQRSSQTASGAITGVLWTSSSRARGCRWSKVNVRRPAETEGRVGPVSCA